MGGNFQKNQENQINVYNITKVWYDIKVNKDTITQISDISNRILVNGE